MVRQPIADLLYSSNLVSTTSALSPRMKEQLLPAYALQDNHRDQTPVGSATFETLDITTGQGTHSSHRRTGRHERAEVLVNTESGEIVTAPDRYTPIRLDQRNDRRSA